MSVGVFFRAVSGPKRDAARSRRGLGLRV